MEIPRTDFNPLPLDFITRFKKNLDRVKVEKRKSNNESEKSLVESKREDLAKLLSDMRDPPKLTVAVYGDTGSGKSSLLNAILDEPNLVPTAGMGKACTSVAIRIEKNEDGEDFAAEIEFLSKEEWERELGALTGDMADGGGDSATYEAARAMMEAVYGEFDDTNLGEVIETDTGVTAKLGSKLVIKHADASSLQDELWKYIDSSEEEEEGGQYWPIVKQVTLRLPKSELCDSGTVLIDLPGVGDSNPARDSVAKKYVLDCDVLMVATKIPRAVDSNTVKAVLGERMFNKVKMDGRRTVLVCTQADDKISPHEVIRKLKLPEAAKWTEESKKLTEQETDLQKQLRQIKAIHGKTPGLLKQETDLYRSLEVARGKRQQLVKEKTSRCAVERNRYVKKNMMKKDMGSSDAEQETIQVFCVSSKDYHKLSGSLACADDDDQPPVFMTPEQTEIPNLRDFLKRASEEKRELKRISIKSEFIFMVSDLFTYLTTMEHGGQRELQTAVERHLQNFESQTEEVIKRADDDITKLRQDNLCNVLDKGVTAAENNAPLACKSWSKPVNASHRRHGGLPHNTYKATVSRDGEYTSSKIGIPINMNADLCDPIFCHISNNWRAIFSEPTWKTVIMDKIRTRFSAIMDAHTKEVLESVRSLGHDVTALSTNIEQLRTDADAKLRRLDEIWYAVQHRSRAITASMPDMIKKEMKPTYALCREKKGPGSFQDIKMEMAVKIERLKSTMFKQLKEQVLVSLKEMQSDVVFEVEDVLMKICKDHKKQIEPLWQEQGGADFFSNVRQCKEELTKLKDDIGQLDQDKGIKRKHEDSDVDSVYSRT